MTDIEDAGCLIVAEAADKVAATGEPSHTIHERSLQM